MQFEGILTGFGNFLKDVVRFEKKKLILPIFAVLMIISAVAIGSHIKSQGWDEDATEASVYTMTGLTDSFIMSSNFNESLNTTSRQRREEIQRNGKEMTPFNYSGGYFQDRPTGLFATEIFLISAIYYGPLHPVAPADNFFQGVSANKAVFFTNEEGYFLTEEMPESLVLISYRQWALTDLADRMNSTELNLTYTEYRDRVAEIKSHGPQSQEVKSYIRNTDPEDPEEKIMGMSPENYERTVNGEIKEVGLIHFIPAIVAAFIWNYLLSGFIIESYRRLRTGLGFGLKKLKELI